MIIRLKPIHRLVCARVYLIFMPNGCDVSFFHVCALVWLFLPKGKVFRLVIGATFNLTSLAVDVNCLIFIAL